MNWLKIHRSLLLCKQFGNPLEFKTWMWLLCKASFSDRCVTIKIGNGLRVVNLKRGQLLFGRHTAEKELTIDGSTVYKILKRFEEDGCISIESNNQFSVISITKYNDFQDYEQVEDFEIIDEVTSGEQPDNKRVAAKEQQSSSKVTHNKKVYKGKKVKTDSVPVEIGGTGATPPDPIKEPSAEFLNFKNWLEKHAPNVEKMDEPFSEEQYFEIKKNSDPADVSRTLKAMHNYKPLLRKNKSAYLTALNWLRRETTNRIPGNGGTFTGSNGQAGLSARKIAALKNF